MILVLGLCVAWQGCAIVVGGLDLFKTSTSRATGWAHWIPAFALLCTFVWVWRFVKTVYGAAAAACFAELIGGRDGNREDPAVAKLLGATRSVALISSVVVVPVALMEFLATRGISAMGLAWPSIALAINFAIKRGRPIAAAYPEPLALERLPGGSSWRIRVIVLERLCLRVAGANLLAVVLVTYRPQFERWTPAGLAWEVNAIEGFLVGIAVWLAIAFSPLPFKTRAPLTVSLGVPVFLGQVLGPALTVVVQYVAVVLALRVVERRDGGSESIGATATTAVRVEALTILGSVLCSFAGTILIGTSGWPTGDLLGEVLGASLALELFSPAPTLAPKVERVVRSAGLAEALTAAITLASGGLYAIAGPGGGPTPAPQGSLLRRVQVDRSLTSISCGEVESIGIYVAPHRVLTTDDAVCEGAPGRVVYFGRRLPAVLARQAGGFVILETPNTEGVLVSIGDFTTVRGSTRLRGWTLGEGYPSIEFHLANRSEMLAPAGGYAVDRSLRPGTAVVSGDKLVGLMVRSPSAGGETVLTPINFAFDAGMLDAPDTVDRAAWGTFLLGL